MQTALITGISGEVGYLLVQRLHNNNCHISALDVNRPDKYILKFIDKFYLTDVSDLKAVDKIFKQNNFDKIFHLASILSSGAEKNPELAANINIKGTLNLLKAATDQTLKNKKPLKFIFPSSIAVYDSNGNLNPITIYGVTKLACENLGNYFSNNYRLLGNINKKYLIDFRAIRFPGLLSPDTIPSGGTSDYASEMIHTAAQNKNYECFVRSDSTIPFMAMSDAVDALIQITDSPKNKLTNFVYDVRGFSVSASEIYEIVKKYFPEFKMTYKINTARQRIIDSWPNDIDDTPALKDWGWKPKYGFETTFSNYLIPKIKQKYN